MISAVLSLLAVSASAAQFRLLNEDRLDRTPKSSASSRTARIVGGVEASSAADFPYQTSLSCECGAGFIDGEEFDCATDNYFSHFCGGSVLYTGEETGVDSAYVLSAAHCFCPQFNSHFGSIPSKVVVGALDLRNSGDAYEVEEVFCHPDYNTTSQDSDIAVLKLTTSISTSGVTAVVTGEAPPEGTTTTLSGWGVERSGSTEVPAILRTVDVQVDDQEECNTAYIAPYNENVITDNMVCASAPGKDSCQGDSGGPAVYDNAGTVTQFGIVSWGFGCADPNYPGVYARITPYDDWIASIVDGSYENPAPGEVTTFSGKIGNRLGWSLAATVSVSGGKYSVILSGPCSADFDLAFYAPGTDEVLLSSRTLSSREELYFEIDVPVEFDVRIGTYGRGGSYDLRIVGADAQSEFEATAGASQLTFSLGLVLVALLLF